MSQYAAVRRLHLLMLEHGEAPAILGGLVRGYSHLSQLTLPVLDMRHRAFAARSLLYAFRLNRMDSDLPDGYWHRGYAFLWLGYPNGVQHELDDAEKRMTFEDKEPPWLELMRFYVDYRFDDMRRLADSDRAIARRIVT